MESMDYMDRPSSSVVRRVPMPPHGTLDEKLTSGKSLHGLGTGLRPTRNFNPMRGASLRKATPQNILVRGSAADEQARVPETDAAAPATLAHLRGSAADEHASLPATESGAPTARLWSRPNLSDPFLNFSGSP